MRSNKQLKKVGKSPNGLYEFSFEVDGMLALFRQPESSAATFPFPTLSAVESWVKAIGIVRGAQAVIDRVEVCKPIQYYRFEFINSSPVRYENNIHKGVPDLVKCLCLQDVCYKVYGHTEVDSRYCKSFGDLHYYQHLLLKRIESGLPRKSIYLGWKKFPTHYFGPCRDSSQPIKQTLAIVQPLRLFDTFKGGTFKRSFGLVEMNDGVVTYDYDSLAVG